MTASRRLAPVPESGLDRLAREVRAEIEQAERAFESAVEHAVRAGEKLIEAKALLKHGEWLPWLAEVGIPARRAQEYIRVAKYAESAHLPATIGEALGKEPKPKPKEDLYAKWLRIAGDRTPTRVSPPTGFQVWDPPGNYRYHPLGLNPDWRYSEAMTAARRFAEHTAALAKLRPDEVTPEWRAAADQIKRLLSDGDE